MMLHLKTLPGWIALTWLLMPAMPALPAGQRPALEPVVVQTSGSLNGLRVKPILS